MVDPVELPQTDGKSSKPKKQMKPENILLDGEMQEQFLFSCDVVLPSLKPRVSQTPLMASSLSQNRHPFPTKVHKTQIKLVSTFLNVQDIK